MWLDKAYNKTTECVVLGCDLFLGATYFVRLIYTILLSTDHVSMLCTDNNLFGVDNGERKKSVLINDLYAIR